MVDGPRFPSNQIYEGPIYDPNPVTPALAKTGQLNPYPAERIAAEHGRYLSGLGAARGGPMPPFQQQLDADEPLSYEDEIYAAEDQDDSFGSGIFDPPGRLGTANTDAGIFASHYSLPGYLARETPFAVSEDVSDVTSGAEVVMVPSGGMAYIERYGKLAGPIRKGPPAPDLKMLPAPPAGRMQPYAHLPVTERTSHPEYGAQHAATPQGDRAGARHIRPNTVSHSPYVFDAPAPLPLQPRIQGRSMQAYQPHQWSTRQLAQRPAERGVPLHPAAARLLMRSTVTPSARTMALGTSDEKTDWLKYGLVGLGIGALAYVAFKSKALK
jgi:hypothetical protein